jgi:hypothetical protein
MSDEQKLPSARSRANERALQNTGNGAGRILDLAASNLTEEQKQALVAKALDAKLDLEVDAQRRENKYYEASRSTRDHIDAYNMLQKEGRLTSHKLTSDLETGAGKLRIESRSGTTCFVATAAYGDPDHPDVVFLRTFRDSKLKANAAGRVFIAFYWKVGPVAAKIVSRFPILRRGTRRTIEGVVWFLKRTYSS